MYYAVTEFNFGMCKFINLIFFLSQSEEMFNL